MVDNKLVLLNEIDSIIQAASDGSNVKISADLGVVDLWLAQNAAKNGFNIFGFRHTIDNYFVKHIRKQHGNEEIERARGQRAVTDEDLRQIPFIIENPDFLIYGAKNDLKNNTISFVKNSENGSTLFVEEIRNGRRRLACDTMYKLAGTSDACSLARNPTLYARNDTSTIKIIDVNAGNVKATN